MISYQREPAEMTLPDLMPLMHKHWAEVAYCADPFDPDTDAYLALERAGLLRLFTVRDDGWLVGYVCYILGPAVNQRTKLVANECGMFVLKEARKGRIALRLLDFAEGVLVAEQVREVHYAVPKEHPGLGIILARRGAQHEDSIYVRRF